MPLRRQLRTAAGRVRRALGSVDEQVAPPSVVPQPPVRFDPLPPLRPFPKAKYVFVVGAVPRWGYSRGWGYGPSGILGVIVIVVLILLLMGRL